MGRKSGTNSATDTSMQVDCALQTNVTMDNYSSDDIDHVVAIIGWNDDINAWRIKNSWGKDWGDDGLMNLAYGYNNIGFNAAWVTVRNIQKVLPNAVLMGLEAINRGIAM